MNTEQPNPQPTILPWHREAAKEIEIEPDSCKTVGYIATIIARHDPHATTLRLLESVVELADTAMSVANRDGAGYNVMAELKDARTHLAEMKGTP